jgi:hypothetical protein
MKVPPFMRSMLITCPESAHLEEIQYEDHPLGMLITSCSRFSPACAVNCERLCAARLDRRRQSPPDAVDEEPTEVRCDTLVSIRI